MDNRSYYVEKDKKKKRTTLFEYDKVEGYNVKPKIKEKDAIAVSKIIFVNQEFSEKIIRKKIEHKINCFLNQLKLISEDDTGGEDAIKKSLMDAEKLRVQIINNYIKYLGHTYESLTLNKLGIIIREFRYRLYMIQEKKKRDIVYDQIKESRRGR